MNTILLFGYIFFNTMTSAEPKEVFLCNNKKTKKYHYSSSCKGLSNCQFKIAKMTLSSAKNKGMTLCAWEAKKNKQQTK